MKSLMVSGLLWLPVLVNLFFCAWQKKKKKIFHVLHGLYIANISGEEGPNPPSSLLKVCTGWLDIYALELTQVRAIVRWWRHLCRAQIRSVTGPQMEKSLSLHSNTERSTQMLLSHKHTSIYISVVNSSSLSRHQTSHCALSIAIAGSSVETFSWCQKPFKPLPWCCPVPWLSAFLVYAEWNHGVFSAPQYLPVLPLLCQLSLHGGFSPAMGCDLTIAMAPDIPCIAHTGCGAQGLQGWRWGTAQGDAQVSKAWLHWALE